MFYEKRWFDNRLKAIATRTIKKIKNLQVIHFHPAVQNNARIQTRISKWIATAF